MGLFDNLLRQITSPGAQNVGRNIGDMLNPFGNPLTKSRKPTGASQRFGGNVLDGRSQRTQDPTMNQPQQADPLMELFGQMLNQLQEPVRMPTGIDTAGLMDQVKKAINPIYDQRISSAQQETGRAKKDVTGMYRALSNDYERLAPQQREQAAQARGQIEDLYGTLRSNIEGNFSRVSDEQGELFKKLGIEDALPEVLADQTGAVTEASRAASENQAQQEQRYMDMGNVDETYYREGSPLATMTGNEINTDLLQQLGEYVNQANAERSSGIQTAYMDQLGQAQTQLGQQQQAATSESARKQEMLWQMLQTQMQAAQKPQELTADSFMGQLPGGMQQNVGSAFTRLQRSPEAVYGKVEDKRNPVPGSFVETTPEWYLAQADEMLKRGEIDAATHQQLLMYIQLQKEIGG